MTLIKKADVQEYRSRKLAERQRAAGNVAPLPLAFPASAARRTRAEKTAQASPETAVETSASNRSGTP